MYFILKGGKLFFAKDEFSIPHGVIHFDQCMPVLSGPGLAIDLKVSDGQMYHFFAENNESKNKWFETIRQHQLTIATLNGKTEQVTIILEAGAQISVKDLYYAGWTAVYYAAIFGYDDIITLFLDRGIDINEKTDYGRNMLHWSASYGHECTVALLLSRGADATILDDILNPYHTSVFKPSTALDCARDNGHEGIVKILEDHLNQMDIGFVLK